MPGPEIFFAMLVSRLGVRPSLLNKTSIIQSSPFLNDRTMKVYSSMKKERIGAIMARLRNIST